MNNTIGITECFYAHQAEGCGGAYSLYGQPTVFYRLGVGCTLTCSGFKVPVMKDGKQLKDANGDLMYGCDSYDSVYKEFKDRSKQMTSKEMIEMYYEKIPTVSPKNLFKPSITISGGEPTLFLKNLELIKFIEHFISRGVPVLMETNGTVMIDFQKNNILKDVIFSISPKLAISGDTKEKRIKPEAIDNIVRNAKNSYLKFVVAKDSWDEDSEEINEILNDVPTYIHNVMLMGLGGVNDENFRRNEKFAFEKSLELMFQFSPRTHISLFSDEKYR